MAVGGSPRVGSIAARLGAIALSAYALFDVGLVTGDVMPEHVGNVVRAVAAGGSALALYAWGRLPEAPPPMLRRSVSIVAAVLLGLVWVDETLHLLGGNLVRGFDALNLAGAACTAAAACGIVSLREHVPSRRTGWALTIGGAWAALFFFGAWLPEGEPGSVGRLVEAVAFVPGIWALVRLGNELAGGQESAGSAPVANTKD